MYEKRRHNNLFKSIVSFLCFALLGIFDITIRMLVTINYFFYIFDYEVAGMLNISFPQNGLNKSIV